MLDNIIHTLTEKTGLKYEVIMKLSAQEIIEMHAKLKRGEESMTNETKIIELLEEILHELKVHKHLNYTINVAPSKINSSEDFFKSLDRIVKVKSKSI